MDTFVPGSTATAGWRRWRGRNARLLRLVCVLLVLGVPAAGWASVVSAPRVVGVEGWLELDCPIEVEVAGLREWAKDNDPRRLVPFIDGYPIAGNTPVAIDLQHGRLLFHLTITRESEDTWRQLLGAPEGLERPVTFSVGPEDDSPFDTVYARYNRLPLTVINPAYGYLALAVVLLTLSTLVWLARTTGIIRHPGNGELGPYDLGRFQMAFWFSLVYASYVSIWLVTDAKDTITPSLLALMGISAGTALGEALIDSDRAGASAQEVRALQAEQRALSAAAGTAGGDDGNDTANAARLLEIEARLQELQGAPVHRSRGFLRDLLSDAHGYRFDRFQILAFTLILGVIFLSAVYNGLTMPEFSPTLLGLMGLSSGTYIGFKFPSNR